VMRTKRPATHPPKNTMFSTALRDGPESHVLGLSANAGEAPVVSTATSSREIVDRSAVMAEIVAARNLEPMFSPLDLPAASSAPWDVNWSERAYELFVARPATILLILIVATLVRLFVTRLIDRLVRRASAGSVSRVLAKTRAGEVLADLGPLATSRRRERALTMGSVLKSIATGIILVITAITVLAELGVDVAPLLTGAGIVGVALGFGAQNFVKDFISGVLMILEDQFGVGDKIDTGHAVGTVEAVGLRVTRLRADDGTIWYVRNGEVLRVGNESQAEPNIEIDT
jgi:small-conductance mechanosensitive channel